MSKIYTAVVQERPDGELFIELDPQLLEEAGMKEGDTVKWTEQSDSSWILSKVEPPPTEWVLVETVTMFRHRYFVEVPQGKSEWALDTVTCEDAIDAGQSCLGETIVSHRVVSKDEALRIVRSDNDYAAGWEDSHVERVFFTPHKD